MRSSPRPAARPRPEGRAVTEVARLTTEARRPATRPLGGWARPSRRPPVCAAEAQAADEQLRASATAEIEAYGRRTGRGRDDPLRGQAAAETASPALYRRAGVQQAARERPQGGRPDHRGDQRADRRLLRPAARRSPRLLKETEDQGREMKAQAREEARGITSEAHTVAHDVLEEGTEISRNLRELSSSLRNNAERLLRDVRLAHGGMTASLDQVTPSEPARGWPIPAAGPLGLPRRRRLRRGPRRARVHPPQLSARRHPASPPAPRTIGLLVPGL